MGCTFNTRARVGIKTRTWGNTLLKPLSVLALFAPEILLPPHHAQHPGGITDIDRGDGVVQRTQSIEDERSMGGIATLCTGNKRWPDETFEVLVAWRYDGELLDEEVRYGVVIRR